MGGRLRRGGAAVREGERERDRRGSPQTCVPVCFLVLCGHGSQALVPWPQRHTGRHYLHPSFDCRASDGEPTTAFEKALRGLAVGAAQRSPARPGLPRPDARTASGGPPPTATWYVED